MSKIIWIDQEIDNKENKGYAEVLKELGYEDLNLFKKIDDAIEFMEKILFEETKIIVSGRLFSEFISAFKKNLTNMCFVPKIIIFLREKERFLENNKDYEKIENKFYTFGGLTTKIDEIKEFLKNENNDSFFISQMGQKYQDDTSTLPTESDEKDIINNNLDVQLTFEYIDTIDKIFLPMFFKSLIIKIPDKNLEEYTQSLYNIYSKKSKTIKKLLDQILLVKNIPIEIISKYYARLYTVNSNFQSNLNKDLRLNKKEKYLPYIKTFYEGVKSKSLKLSNDKILYRCSNLSDNEINKIKMYLEKKIDDLPRLIVFSKSFLSFSKDIKQAKKFFKNTDNNLPKILFILKNDKNERYNLSTHGDIEKISCYPNEKEVLFFPFSSFEIKDIQEKEIEIEIEIEEEKRIEKIKGYEINLLYLGKYLKKIENDKNTIQSENELPYTEFKKQLCEFGLIEEEKIEKINTIKLYKAYKQYEKETKNIIIGEIEIKSENVNRDVRIINSFENVKRDEKKDDKDDDWKYENEKEIKENTEIEINGELIKFSYHYTFTKEGKYKIIYSFKNNLTKTNNMFYECKLLTNLDLSHFNSENVSNMNAMFGGCESLLNLDLTNLNTQNVKDMSYMFWICKSLKNLDLSEIDAQNVVNMNNMFNNCKSLTKLNLSNLNTQNVSNMSNMFSFCSSLTSLNLSSFNTQNVKDLSGMFSYCSLLTNLNLSSFNTKNVSNMSNMFSFCNSLKSIDLSKFNTRMIKNMSRLFYECHSLISLNLSNFNTQNVTNMSWMFYDCNSLTELNLLNFNAKDDTDLTGMFGCCTSLKKNSLITKANKILQNFDKIHNN